MIEIVGWAASVILLLTLIKQVYKQYRDATSEGISMWLFIGQLVASILFTVYSIAVRNWVFTVTNSLLTLNNVIGIVFYFRFKRD